MKEAQSKDTVSHPLRTQEEAAINALPKAFENNEKLRAALAQISRMRCNPDKKITLMTLTAAIQIAQRALGETA